jgi:hypothetical protein
MFDLRAGRLPEHADSRVLALAQMAEQRLEQKRLPGLRAIVFLPPREWRFVPSYVRVIAITNSRKHYSLLDRLSRLLSESYLEMLILPDIHVIGIAEWEHHRHQESSIWQEISRKGLLVYQGQRELLW